MTPGRPGAVSGLRLLKELREQSAGAIEHLVELRVGRLLDGRWSKSEGNAWSSPFSADFPLFAVQSLRDVTLTAAETVSECGATPGTFYADSAVDAGHRWGDGVTLWGQLSPVARWGAFPRLHIHLTDSSSPRTTSVVAQLSVWMSERSSRGDAAVPQFGPEKLTDPGVEAWLDPSTPEHWTLQTPSGFAAVQEESFVRAGAYSARVEWDGTNLTIGGMFEAQAAVVGQWYRFAGEYRTDPTNDAQDAAVARIGNDTDGWIREDGRTFTPAGARINLSRTAGEWRGFYVDFIAHAATVRAWIGAAAVSGQAGGVTFDRLTFRQIRSWEQAHPRIEAGAKPRAEVGTNDVIFGGDRTGSGQLSLINADGFMSKLFGEYRTLGQEAAFWERGVFRDGQGIHGHDWCPIFTGRMQRPVANDKSLKVPVRDVRGDLHRKIPPRKYSTLEHPRLDISRDGQRRPVFLGPKTGIAPARIDLSADGLGVYEIGDTGWDMPFPLSPAGLKAIDAVYAYLSKEAAENRSVAERVLLVLDTDYSVDLAKGTITLLRNVGPINLDETKKLDAKKLDFDIGAGEITATIPAGTYSSAEALAATIETAIRAAIGGADTTGLCQFDLDAKAYRVGRTSGTFNMLASSGSNRDLGIYPTIGFASSEDLDDSESSYLGDPVLTDIDQQHVLRVDAQGYKDDAVGTYTGTADALVTVGADVTRFLWHRLLRRALSLIDEPSFLAARTSRPALHGIFLSSEVSTLDVFESLKLSTLSDMAVGGGGQIALVPYSSDVPASAERLVDRDYLTWEMTKPFRDVYAGVVVEFDERPDTGRAQTRRKLTPHVALTAGRPEHKTVRVYLVDENDAQALARDLAIITGAELREVMTSLKARLRDARPGTIVVLSRQSALDASGALDNVAFRVASVATAETVQLRLLELVQIGS